MILTSKNAVVTGGLGGIGAAICEELLNNGINGIAIIDIQDNGQEIITQWREKYNSQRVEYFCCDVSKADLKECYMKIIDTLKCIDIVINSAGINRDNQFEKMININLTGLINSSLIAVDHMRIDRQGKGGIVINIGSLTGIEPFHFFPCYSATKFAVISFTRSLMNDIYYQQFGVKFVALCPGLTKTPLIPEDFGLQLLFPEFKPHLEELIYNQNIQEASAVGKAVIEILNKDEQRGVWIIDDSQLTEHKFKPLYNF